MSVAELDPFADLISPDDLIGGLGDAPAYQTTGGQFQEVPKAELNAPVAPATDPFSDLEGNTQSPYDDDAGPFNDLLPVAPKPETATEAALAETPVFNPRNEQIRAAPTFFGELQAGRLGSAYYLAKEFLGEQFKGQEIESGRGKGLLGTEEQIPASSDDSLPVRAAKAFINVSNRTMAGLTGPGMLPLAVIGGAGGAAGKLVAGAFGADMASHLPETWKMIEEAEQNEPWSQERFEAGLDAVMQGLMIYGAASHATRKAPVRSASESEALPTTTERPIEEAARPDNPAQRMVPIEEIPKGEIDALQIRSTESEIPRTVEAGENQPGSGREAGPGESIDSSQARAAEIPAIEAETVVERVPENLTRSPEVDRLINEPPPQEQAGPRLLEGEKQGDLISSTQAEDFRLVGEKGTDFAARQAETQAKGQAAEEARLKAESEQSTLDEFREYQESGGVELLDALKSEGGLPALSSERQHQFVGELQNVREELKSPSRKEPIKYAEVFKKDAQELDALTTRMRAKGFNVETPGEFLDLVRDRIRTGKKIFGMESMGALEFEPRLEGGAFGGAGGKRFRVKPKGMTPTGDKNFLHIPSGPKRIFKGLEREGAADILGRTKNKVGKLLSEATDRHVDIEQELTGRLSTEMTRPAKGLSSKAVDKAYDEIPAYMAAKENSRPLPTLSKTAQELVGAWENIAEKTGKIMAANDVQVFDPATKKYRPTFLQGRKYVPRMFKQEVEQVLRDRNKNVPLWNDLVADLAKQRGIPEADAATLLQAEAGRFGSNGFMGAIDMARTSKMPESFYEYDLRNIAARYIPQFSERMAQIIAFGQRLGPREAPVRQNLWDVAKKEAADVPTQELLNVMEDMSVNLRPKTFGGRFMTGAQTLATGAYLTSPKTTIRNLISGMTSTPEILGVRRSAQALTKMIGRKAFADAKEVGVIRDSIGAVLHADKLGDSFVHDVIRTGTDKALKYSGQSGSESLVRTHGFLAADIFAKDAVKALNKRPTSMRSKEALGLFKRMKVDAEKIVAEKGNWETGPETRKFIRTFVRETQGGYRYNQVPLWANSNNGRFLYQYGRWGTMRARNIVRNAIKPAFGEEVQWHGKTMTRVDFRPIIKMALAPVVLGETFAAIEQILFGKDRSDSSISEIVAAWKEDEKKAILMAMERVANDVIMAGSLGIFGQPLDWARSLKGQSRLKNPTEPPGLGSIRALHDLGQKALDQGGQITRKDILEFANAFAPGIKQSRDAYRNVMDEPLYEAENDVKTLRASARRWADQAGMDVSLRAGRGDFRKSPMAPEYEPIKEALLVGDSQRASFLKKAFLDKQPNRTLAAKNLKASIRMSQPFRAGPYNAKKYRDDFKEWAKKNLSEADWQQTERIQERYQRAAVAAELW